MEVIICTPAHSELLVTHLHQKLAPTESQVGSKRGQDKGDASKTKSYLKLSQRLSGKIEIKSSRQKKQNTINSQNTFHTLDSFGQNNSLTSLRPFWAGGFMVIAMVSCLFLGAPEVHASDRAWDNIDLAKKVIENVTPVVNPQIQPDQTSAATLAMTANNFIEKPLVVETQITPEPPKKVLAAVSKRTPADYSLVAGPHYFPYGYCTYYVSQKRTVTWSGNAGTWLGGAKAAGLETGKTPKVGAIMVTAEGGKVGHVAYVESVDGSDVKISEMNYKGFGIVSSRTINSSSKVIRGYVY